MPGAAVASDRVQFGTTSVQLRERKNGALAPKRHQMKHLEFWTFLVRDQGSEVQILSPRPNLFKECPLAAAIRLVGFGAIVAVA
jgi:hypothetical protein